MAPQTRSRSRGTKMLPGEQTVSPLIGSPSKTKSKRTNVPRGGNGLLSRSHVVSSSDEAASDAANYALLVILYTLQGIPMGLTMTIPLLIQQRFATVAKAAATAAAAQEVSASTTAALSMVDTSSATLYNAQAMFALCSWPFSLKLLWAPLVDAVYSKVRGGGAVGEMLWLIIHIHIPVQGARDKSQHSFHVAPLSRLTACWQAQVLAPSDAVPGRIPHVPRC